MAMYIHIVCSSEYIATFKSSNFHIYIYYMFTSIALPAYLILNMI